MPSCPDCLATGADCRLPLTSSASRSRCASCCCTLPIRRPYHAQHRAWPPPREWTGGSHLQSVQVALRQLLPARPPAGVLLAEQLDAGAAHHAQPRPQLLPALGRRRQCCVRHRRCGQAAIAACWAAAQQAAARRVAVGAAAAQRRRPPAGAAAVLPPQRQALSYCLTRGLRHWGVHGVGQPTRAQGEWRQNGCGRRRRGLLLLLLLLRCSVAAAAGQARHYKLLLLLLLRHALPAGGLRLRLRRGVGEAAEGVLQGARVKRLHLPAQRHHQQARAGRNPQHLATEAKAAHVAVRAKAVELHRVLPRRRRLLLGRRRCPRRRRRRRRRRSR